MLVVAQRQLRHSEVFEMPSKHLESPQQECRNNRMEKGGEDNSLGIISGWRNSRISLLLPLDEDEMRWEREQPHKKNRTLCVRLRQEDPQSSWPSSIETVALQTDAVRSFFGHLGLVIYCCLVRLLIFKYRAVFWENFWWEKLFC